MGQRWWIILAEIDGERIERQIPATDRADARRYFLDTNAHWRGVHILSITLFGLNDTVLVAN